jgi:hypothetical protein
MTKMRLKRAVNPVMSVSTNAGWMRRMGADGDVAEGRETARTVYEAPVDVPVQSPSVMKMMVFVPKTDQMNVIATASIAVHSDASMFVWIGIPRAASRLLRIPRCAKNRTATIPMTTQLIAVGRK